MHVDHLDRPDDWLGGDDTADSGVGGLGVCIPGWGECGWQGAIEGVLQARKGTGKGVGGIVGEQLVMHCRLLDVVHRSEFGGCSGVGVGGARSQLSWLTGFDVRA